MKVDSLGYPLTLAQLEEEHIRDVLSWCKGNKTLAACYLGINRRTLYRKLENRTDKRRTYSWQCPCVNCRSARADFVSDDEVKMLKEADVRLHNSAERRNSIARKYGLK